MIKKVIGHAKRCMVVKFCHNEVLIKYFLWLEPVHTKTFHCMPLNYTDVLIPPAVPSNMVYIYTMYLEKVKWKIWGITLQHSVYGQTDILGFI